MLPNACLKRKRSTGSLDGNAQVVKENLIAWFQLDGRRPARVSIPQDCLGGHLKSIIKSKCRPLLESVELMSIVLAFEDTECIEDTPISDLLDRNSAKNPFLVRVDLTSVQLQPNQTNEEENLPVSDEAEVIVIPKPTESGSITYLECREGTSDKFYELWVHEAEVRLRYGKRGTDGVTSTKHFKNDTELKKFVEKTINDKMKKGYRRVESHATLTETADNELPSEDPRADLEVGKRVSIQGSSKLPYMLKKFNGGYSCTCPGFIMQIKTKGIQATTCKHLKLVRGEEAEALRCLESAGVPISASGSSKKNISIPDKIALANTWKSTIDPTGYVMSEKLDGMRAYWNMGQLWSRSGLPIAAPDWFVAGLPSDIDLDGELYLGRQMFDACMSIARRTDASEEWRKLTYVIFDAPLSSGGIMARFESVASLINEKKTPYARLHDQKICLGIDHLLQELTRVELIGGEGLMLRQAMAAHRGGRNNDLLKVKNFNDTEALVVEYEEGKGKCKGMVGSLICILRDGTYFKVGSGLTDSQRTYTNAPRIGSIITFKYFELTKDGVPRFPIYLRERPDASLAEFPSSFSALSK